MQTTTSYAVPTATCPGQDGQGVTDGAGVQYWIKCSSDTSGGSQYATGTNVYSFNDCFYICTNNIGLTAPATCGGFTYAGGANGQGGGTCYIKTGTGVTFNPVADINRVGGIKKANYGAYTTTTTTTSSSSAVCTRRPPCTEYGKRLLPGSAQSPRFASNEALADGFRTFSQRRQRVLLRPQRYVSFLFSSVELFVQPRNRRALWSNRL